MQLRHITLPVSHRTSHAVLQIISPQNRKNRNLQRIQRALLPPLGAFCFHDNIESISISTPQTKSFLKISAKGPWWDAMSGNLIHNFPLIIMKNTVDYCLISYEKSLTYSEFYVSVNLGLLPWRRAWQPTQNSGLENSTDRGAWQGIYSPWGCKEWDTAEWLTLRLLLPLLTWVYKH